MDDKVEAYKMPKQRGKYSHVPHHASGYANMDGSKVASPLHDSNPASLGCLNYLIEEKVRSRELIVQSKEFWADRR